MIATDEKPTPTTTLPAPRDVLALAKPGITLMSIIVAAGSMALARATAGATLDVKEALIDLFLVGASVAGAGALNMVWEQDLDKKMSRTMNRPLPAGRMKPTFALVFGIVLGVGSVPAFYIASDPVTATLNLIALVSYVLIYTPLKQRSAWSLVVGAVPGAMPALLGYTAATGVIDEVGIALFAIVFFWQIPHFLAITLYRASEYTAAGHVVWAHTLGKRTVRFLTIITAIPLVAASLIIVPLGVAGPIYAAVAMFLGLWFLRRCVRRYADETVEKWGRRVFLATLVHQTVLFAALAIDVGGRAVWPQ